MMSGNSKRGIVICSAASGEELVRFAADDLPVAEREGISVRALKQFLAKRINLSRFRQRLLTEGGELLHDDIQLSPPLNLQLVKLELLKPDKKRDMTFFAACQHSIVAEVEDMLNGPQDPDTVQTSLHVAAQNGCLEVVDLLLEAGADKEICDMYGRTPLHWAAYCGHLEIVRFLLQSGADKDKCDTDGTPPLHYASEQGQLEVVRLLLESGAEKDSCGIQGRTPLHFAVTCNQLEVARLLLEAGADKDKFDFEGQTALHISSQLNHLELARLLLQTGADKDKSDNQRATPLHFAAENGHLEVVRLLLVAGADGNKCLGDGRLPLQLASDNDHREVVDLLRSFPSYKKQRCRFRCFPDFYLTVTSPIARHQRKTCFVLVWRAESQ